VRGPATFNGYASHIVAPRSRPAGCLWVSSPALPDKGRYPASWSRHDPRGVMFRRNATRQRCCLCKTARSEMQSPARDRRGNIFPHLCLVQSPDTQPPASRRRFFVGSKANREMTNSSVIGCRLDTRPVYAKRPPRTAMAITPKGLIISRLNKKAPRRTQG
jgi:hypothetical protein